MYDIERFLKKVEWARIREARGSDKFLDAIVTVVWEALPSLRDFTNKDLEGYPATIFIPHIRHCPIIPIVQVFVI